MKFSLPTLLFAALASLLVLPGCEKDSETTTVTTTESIAGALAPATINVYGRLTDAQGDPVADARVQAGSRSTVTDEEGLYRIDGADVAVTFGYVTFEHPAYLTGSRTVYASDRETYRVDVELLARSQSYGVDAAAGGTVSIAGSEATVAFGPGAFAKTDGTPVASGEVRVIAHYLDAADDATYRQMPGDLRALAADATSNTDFTLLTTFGMVGVELTDAAGAPVELADGQTATLTMPLSAEALAAAPATIPLWYFDEGAGIWREEGEATLDGDAYVGEVRHFTFWNCDIPTEYARLCATFEIEGEAGDTSLTTQLYVVVESTNWGRRGGYTDGAGRVCGIVPAGEALTLLVYGYAAGCRGEAVFSVPVAALTGDTDLGVITIPRRSASLVTVSGAAECNGAPVTRGAVRVYQNGRQVEVGSIAPDGSFSVDLVSCDSSEIGVRVTDYVSRAESDIETFPFAPAVATGVIGACTQPLTSFFDLTVDGVSYFGDSLRISADGPFLFGSGDGFELGQSYGFFFTIANLPDPLTAGTYTVDLSGQQRSQWAAYGDLFPAARGYLRIDGPAVPLAITQVPDATSDYVVGTLGPIQQTTFDSTNNVTVTYELELTFSAELQ